MLLVANAFGYASCWITGPLIAKAEIEALVKPAGDWSLVAMVALGRRVPNRPLPSPTPRRAEDETVSYFL